MHGLAQRPAVVCGEWRCGTGWLQANGDRIVSNLTIEQIEVRFIGLYLSLDGRQLLLDCHNVAEILRATHQSQQACLLSLHIFNARLCIDIISGNILYRFAKRGQVSPVFGRIIAQILVNFGIAGRCYGVCQRDVIEIIAYFCIIGPG